MIKIFSASAVEKTANIYRLLRIARDIKVKDLADELRVTPAYINAIENGTRKPSVRLIKDYSDVFDVDEELILRFASDADQNQGFEKMLLSLLKSICSNDG